MADFKSINTQEELDAALAPYREKAAKYDELAGKNLEQQVAALQQQLNAANDELSASAQEIAGLKLRAETAEGKALRAKVAHANRLPYEMAGRLKGSTEEELTADAKDLAKLLAPPAVAPLASTEPGGITVTGTDAAYIEMAAALGGN